MEPQTFFLISIGILIGICIGYLLGKIFFLQTIKSHRKDAINKSKSVILGGVNEKIAPLLPQFPYSYKDLSFLGKGIDYVVFDGLSQGDLKKIVFIEIKSGQSQLNQNEKMIKNIIDAKKVSYEVIRI
ncbi:MAG TPA: Holliday junction resolvase-like protein [Candidatus Absconditabacterales bacterium]|nr:Holliday junction resolvase-like protein [Candidatus Absconditabacterales bacterium]HMT27423.1 Holliday junction resolvase-like protein [Candidatus Absconditabacterales bacterium]